MKTKRRTAIIFNLFLFTSLVFSDYVEVSRETTIYSQPSIKSNSIALVKVGDLLLLNDDGKQVKGYYKVVTQNTKIHGWIYRNFVRRHKGAIPIIDPAKLITDPFSDFSYYFTDSDKRLAAKHLQIGKPQAFYERTREGFAYCLDARLKIPVWVQYEMSKEDLDGPGIRKNVYTQDETLPISVRVTGNDYVGSGYDIGHMAPAEDMTRSQNITDDSFIFSNMAPQIGVGFNRHIWAQLEAAVRDWVNQRGRLTIITGPVFEVKNNTVTYSVIGNKNVAVPTHFFKIIVDANNKNNVETIAFLMPNSDLSGQKYGQYIVSIDEIEDLTGLDFLTFLPVEIQNDVEAKKTEKGW